MDDDGTPSRSSSRTPSAQHVIRRVPGSFDEDGISPVKESFDDQPFARSAPDENRENIPPFSSPHASQSQAQQQHQQQQPHQSQQRPTPHPSAPTVVEPSLADSSALDLAKHSDTQAEIAVREHLQDIESSFAAPPSPIPTSTNGVDDTFLFDSPSKKQPPQQHQHQQQQPDSSPANHRSTSNPPAISLHPARDSHDSPSYGRGPSNGSQRLPKLTIDPDASNLTSSTSALEAFSSSPSGPATHQAVSRALSSRASTTRTDDDNSHASGDDHRGTQLTPQHSLSESSTSSSLHPLAEAENPTNPGATPSKTAASDAGNTPGQALRFGKRPKFLRSRGASQRSSVSSFNTDPESDVTVGLGADYALQSGGALPALSVSGSNNALSRSISMGSMASGIEDMHDSSGHSIGFGGLETLEESPGRPRPGRGPGGPPPQDEDLLQTPKAASGGNSGPMAAPTDTVIARHVRNVHVPESLAREYQNKGGLVTPRKPSEFGAAVGTPAAPATATRQGHGGKNLTLKEQSSTIERLSKENFDLKLKVMFLSDRLDKLSEEGVKEMISENVELKTGLAVLQRDNKVLRRRVKELEKHARDDDDQQRPGTSRSGVSEDQDHQAAGGAFDHEAAQEMEEELIYLRERVEEYATEIERLRGDNMNKEAEKRRMADVVKSLGEKTGESLGRQEETDVWKDLLEQETARREQADDDNRRLRDEVFRLKQEMSAAAAAAAAAAGHHHTTTNIYNITKKKDRERDHTSSPSRPVSAFSGDMDGGGSAGGGGGGSIAANGSLSAASTLVEELRRESEQLRHENAELRREVGAQTSMLTSRNREKERLYQEIEDLKMAQRRGGPAPSTVDSILERSASRAGAAHERSNSRTSAGAATTANGNGGGGGANNNSSDNSHNNHNGLDEAEREELENKLAEARDRNNELKMQNQDLQRELEACMEDFEAAVEGKKQVDELVGALQEDLETAMNDLVALQAERDEALQEHANLEAEFESLRKEAQEEIDALEGEADQRTDEIGRLQQELGDRSENFDALQEEMRKMSEALVRLEDEQANKQRRVQQLEQELGEANKESEELEAKLLEANDKANRLSVQQESSQGEIAFLREEQEGDKIRIGDLEAALANAEQSVRDEKDRTRELEQRLAGERRQREIVANREKEEVQQFVNELNREASSAKDEVRKLRKNLRSRELEATEWKERLMELENNLREALGDLNGTRSSLLKSIAKLQRELEDTVRELDSTKASLMEKEGIVRQRDALLESHGLESRKLAEMLDKERQAHRNTKHQFETFQKTHQHVTRTVTSQDSRIGELENAKAQDKRRILQLENDFREQLTERNNLLLILWTKLSALCGTDWAHGNSLINGRALPSLEAVATMLPGFSKNLLAAVRTIEAMMGGFQAKIKTVEKDLWREYQTLESHLDMRTKKLDRLESIVRNGVATGTLGPGDVRAKLARLEDEYRRLKVENHTLRTAAEVRSRAAAAAAASTSAGNNNNNNTAIGPDGMLLDDGMLLGGSPSPSVPTGPRDRGRDRASRIPKSGSSRSGTSSSRPGTMARATSSHSMNLAAEEFGLTEPDDGAHQRAPSRSSGGGSASGGGGSSGGGGGGYGGGGGGTMDNKWMLRLRDLEYKLKAEREGRVQDRGEAIKRINASETENQLLRDGLERERRRQGR